jgi:hypothetical protein
MSDERDETTKAENGAQTSRVGVDADVRLLLDIMENLKPTAKTLGIDLRAVTIKGTVYYFPILPAA